ncbi:MULTISPECIES: DUF4160 domain-containing protein [unclassified Acetobacterium]|uniref:DUF4160 domain-containing protein n=1 Tax=unclassified Acetobacterium TaxID=2638182 RepID=UPI002ACAA961|nr:DUF4160 domain-containing protein [Acetobacterium sp. K1/6]MDZ5726713.1 DUF4160 domain-containing protein [Acetobacterium sp. K1/6]
MNFDEQLQFLLRNCKISVIIKITYRKCQIPELCRFYNIVIRMLYSDNFQHHKPHFHVYYNEYEASVGIDGDVLVGNLPVKQLKSFRHCHGTVAGRIFLSWLGLSPFNICSFTAHRAALAVRPACSISAV